MDSVELKLAHLRSELLADSAGTSPGSTCHASNDHTSNGHTSDSSERSHYFNDDDISLEDTRELDRFLRQQKYSISSDGDETNLDKTHLQRTSSLSDAVFDDSDGGVVSRSLTFFTVKSSEMEIMEENIELTEVDDAVFGGIVPLTCVLSLGRKETLEKLARVSEPYIDAVVKLISSALGKVAPPSHYGWVQYSQTCLFWMWGPVLPLASCSVCNGMYNVWKNHEHDVHVYPAQCMYYHKVLNTICE